MSDQEKAVNYYESIMDTEKGTVKASIGSSFLAKLTP